MKIRVTFGVKYGKMILGGDIMAFFDKLNDLAKTASEKTENVIEMGKLTAKIEGEQRNSEAIIKKIGEHFAAKMDAGESYDEEAAAIYQSLLQSREAIAGMRADLEELKSPKPAEAAPAPAPAAKFCSNCGTKLIPEAKFCTNCGKEA